MTTFDGVRDRIQRAITEDGVPAIAVAVARRGRILWEEGFGWADRERGIPATSDTMFSLASISKPVTTTALMTLVEAGRVDLDRPIDDYLGAARLTARIGDARDATVRRVCDHTAGLPTHYQFFYEDGPYRRPSMEDTIRRYAHLVWPPGERLQYSNLGYGLLDDVIARASGASYADYLRRELFLKLGMTRSSVGLLPVHDGLHAIRYDADGRRIPYYDFDHPGGSAVYASAHDLVRFGMFHLKDHLADQAPILPDATIDEMHRPTATDGRMHYGLGWMSVERADGRRMVAHGGGMPGVRTTLDLVPDEDLAVVVLASSSYADERSDGVDEISDLILSVVVPGWVSERPDLSRPMSDSFGPVDAVAGSWEGIVATPAGDRRVRLDTLADGYRVRIDDQPAGLLTGVTERDGRLQGTFLGDLGTPDTDRARYSIRAELDRRGDRITGVLNAVTPGVSHFSLAHWVDLSPVLA